MAFCIVLDVDFAVVSDVLPLPYVVHVDINVRSAKPAYGPTHTQLYTRVFHSFFLRSYFVSSSTPLLLQWPTRVRVLFDWRWYRAFTSMDLHFLLSWIFAFRIFVYVFFSLQAPLSHFGCLLKIQFSVCALRFILNYISFFCWSVAEWSSSANRGGGKATNNEQIFNMRTHAFAACNIDNNHYNEQRR